MRRVTIVGAGPAGCSAALAALAAGAEAVLYDRSVFPRHKVCGEFLSPELGELLDGLGVWRDCEALAPAVINRVHLTIGKAEKCWRLAEPARGLSRFALDEVMLARAQTCGAAFSREAVSAASAPAVIAYGRHHRAPSGNRLFGFKAHFEGSADDAIRLYFFDGCYAGVNAIEGGRTNVCGVAPEAVLRQVNFEIEALLTRFPPLCERLDSLAREMAWLKTGPLVYAPDFRPKIEHGQYRAGDALGFVDPFTGSGMLGAVATGLLAGDCAARGEPVERYIGRCRRVLQGQYRAAQIFRVALERGWAEKLLPLIPGNMMFRLTRPRLQTKSR